MRIWTDLIMLVGGSLLALLFLGYLHGEFQPGWALASGAIGAVALRRALRSQYAELPPFLVRPIDVGIAGLGVAVVSASTLAVYPPVYWLLKWQPGVALAFGSSVTGVALFTVVYSHKRLARQIAGQERHLNALRELALKSQLGALQAQMNPHFLFNALNTLAELVHEDADLAEDLIADLAHMMRYALRSSRGHVRLEEEVDMVRRYLRLEGARLGERLRVGLDVDPDTGDVLVPGLILQPLVENAVKYAIAEQEAGGRVAVAVTAVGDAVHIAVEDDGPGLPEPVRRRMTGEDPSGPPVGTGGAGGGLANVDKRLRLAYGDRADRPGLSFSVPEGGGLRIDYDVPRVQN